jgi:hypothetical protein
MQNRTRSSGRPLRKVIGYLHKAAVLAGDTCNVASSSRCSLVLR